MESPLPARHPAGMEDRSVIANRLCHPLGDPLRDDAEPWQESDRAQIGGALAAALPLICLALWMYVLRDSVMTLRDMIGGPLIGGGILILWVLLIHHRLCGDRLASLGLRSERPWIEVVLGLVLAAGLLAFHLSTGPLLARLFAREPPPAEILELLRGLGSRPAMLALWFGPVVWVGIAGFEELWRVHLLRRLWRVWPGAVGRWVIIVGAAAVVAGVHLYQPPAVMLSIGLLSVFKGWLFMVTGRFWSLVIAHALYDSVQVAMALVAVQQLAG